MGRKIPIITGVAIAVCAVAFAIAGWGRIGSVAPVIGALAAVSGVGVSAWAATRKKAGTRRVVVEDTGDVRAAGQTDSVTGAQLSADSTAGDVRVRRTGSIEGGGGVTGYRED
jgi:fermentation-respiration switch protein FrsA (DUF1100 family)